MKCNKAHKWIALYREGELDAGDQNRLREHLAGCESCNRLYRSYQENDRITAAIRSQNPEPDNKDILTGRIMNTIAEIKKRPGETGFASLIDRIIDLAMLPAVRRIAVTCILILAAVFIYQQAYIYSSTARLEKQLSAAGKAGLVRTESKDMQDCLKKSERYFSKVKTGQIKIESRQKINISENPEVFRQYASYFCSHKYPYPGNSFRKDVIVIPDF
jgi:Putative zinc-finger